MVLGALAWIAMFGLKREQGRERPDRHCAWSVWSVSDRRHRLPHVRLFSGDVASAGGILGKLVGNRSRWASARWGEPVAELLLASITLATGRPGSR